MKRTLSLLAEAIAWPLVNPQAFRLASCRVEIQPLNLSFQERLLALGQGRAEEIEHFVWEHLPGSRRALGPPLNLYLRHHAKRLISSGSCLRLKPDHDEPGREILFWRYLSLSLPPLVLGAAAMPFGAVAPPTIQLLDPTIVPAGPHAHLHLHRGAVCPFELLWSHLASTLDLKKPDRSGRPLDPARRETGEPPKGMGSWREWRGWLTRAMLARRRLYRHTLGLTNGFLRLERRGDPVEALLELASGRIGRTDSYREARLVRSAIGTPWRRRKLIRREEDVWQNDPLGDGSLLPEARFLALTLEYMARNGEDEGFLRLWTQYLRIKCILFRHLVADTAECGLSRFAPRYHRIGNYVGDALDRLAPQLALAEPELHIRSLELRSAPPKHAGRLKEQVKALSTFPGRSEKEVGWVFHFIRDASASFKGICRSHERSARKLARCIQYRPDSLRFVRGLDIASEELKGPLWLALPALRHLRNVSRAAARKLPGLEPLRLTLHVGEDFRHIASGLRAIHEPFLWKVMERGDRLGHALALGVDVAKWCSAHPMVLQPRIERILDLAWMLEFCSTTAHSAVGTTALDGATILSLQCELSQHLDALTGREQKGWQVGVRILKSLGKKETLEALGYPTFLAAQPQDPILELIWLYLCSDSWRRKAEHIVSVPTAVNSELLSALQRKLAAVLAAWQTTIEVCPSSNLFIGGMDHPLDQPMFQLRPIDQKGSTSLPVAISADDPITFSTRLADEYAYAWAGMVVAGRVSPTYARAWLDDAVETAWRARFTMPTARSRRRADT